MKLHTLIRSLLGAALLTTASWAGAGTVTFTISAATLEWGAGYGDDGKNEENGTLLDVRFTKLFTTPVTRSLSSPGDWFVFNFGRVANFEPDKDGGILQAETDNLGVEATFTFASPIAGSRTVTAVGTAQVGPLHDATGGQVKMPELVDYTLSWDPIEVLFGDGGKFSVAINTLEFWTQANDPQWLTATVTLLSMPSETGRLDVTAIQQVPEPGSLALVGVALGLSGLWRRRRPSA